MYLDFIIFLTKKGYLKSLETRHSKLNSSSVDGNFTF